MAGGHGEGVAGGRERQPAAGAIEATLGLDPGSGGTVAQALAGKLDKSGGSMGGDIAMASHRVTGLADPSSAQDAVTKAYVDAVHSALVASLPAGVIVSYGGTSAPAGWVLCDGSTFDGNEEAYQALWAAIGTTYGGTGQSSFKVPDLRGRVPIGAGTATGATGATGHVLGTSGGEETHQLSSQEMPAHTHTATATDAGHAHGNIPLYSSSATGDNLTWNPGAPRIWPNGNASTTTSYALVSVTNANTGGGERHNNMPPYLAINYLMKY